MSFPLSKTVAFNSHVPVDHSGRAKKRKPKVTLAEETFKKVLIVFLVDYGFILVALGFHSVEVLLPSMVVGGLFSVICFLGGIGKLCFKKTREEGWGLMLAAILMLLVGFVTFVLGARFVQF